ncbi:MAG: DUF6431 domain-containing protein [Lachnospiraceae bacterium]|nr:DUF6431 domain-containing protein [Lachnospiraceae bacterium]
MVILYSFQTEVVNNGDSVRILSEDLPLCPNCGRNHLIYRDSVDRRYRKTGGERFRVLIPRGRCESCNKLHRMLPLILCPFKQYLSDVILDIVENRIPPAELALIDYPCDTTISRWHEWAGDGFVNLEDQPLFACFSKNARTSAAQSLAAFFSKTG